MTERRRALWLTITGALLLALSWWAASAEGISGLEEDVFRFFNDWPDWLEGPIWPIMQAGAIAAVPVVAAVAWLATKRWRLGLGVALSGFVAWVLAKVVKELVERGRPQEFLADVNFRPEWEGLGFVSGHVAVVFAMATIVSPYVSRPWKLVVWSIAGATAILRMYTAAHLPLDNIGGAGLGMAVGGLWRMATAESGRSLVPGGGG